MWFVAVLALVAVIFCLPARSESVFDAGSGTQESPYVISTGAQLDRLRDYCGPAHKNTWFVLAADLDVSGTAWEPIGRHVSDDDGSQAFQGRLDGRGHVVRGVTVQTNSLNHAGLFASLCDADIRNVHLTGVSVSQAVNAVSSSGGLAAFARNTRFSSCTVQGSVQSRYAAGGFLGRDGGGSSFSGCGSDCSVAASFFAGGFMGMGHAGSSVTQSHAKGRVSVTSESHVAFDTFFHGYGGGMVAWLPEADGMDRTTFRSCYASCALQANDAAKAFSLGGFAGFASSADFVNCSSLGSVVVVRSAKGCAGGFVADSVLCRYSNCSARGRAGVTSGQDHACAGGFAGRNDQGAYDNCYSSALVKVQLSSSEAGTPGAALAGGFTGYNSRGGTFAHCYASGKVVCTANTNYTMVGGFCGYDREGNYADCLVAGDVEGSNSNSGGDVYGGGILGYVAQSSLRGNVFARNASVTLNASTAAMSHAANNRNGALEAVTGGSSVWSDHGFAFGRDDEAPWQQAGDGLPVLYVEESLLTEHVRAQGTEGSSLVLVSDTAWTASSSEDWLSISPSSGTGDAVLAYDVAAWNGIGVRTATVTISAPDAQPAHVTVVQTGGAAALSVAPARLVMPKGGGHASFAVSCNSIWSVTAADVWLTLTDAQGSGNGAAAATVAPNADVAARSAVLTFASFGVSCTATVVQRGQKRSWDEWREDEIIARDPSVNQTAPGDSPAGDGIANLMKYATGLDPLKPCGSVTAMTLRQDADGQWHMALGWPVNPEAVDVTYEVEGSTDLETWMSRGAVDVAGKARGEYVDPAPIGKDAPSRQFLRLKVSRNTAE